MSKALSIASLWALAALAVLAPMANEAVKALYPAVAAVGPASGEADDTRFMGVVGPEPETVADVVHAGRASRDIRFHLDNDDRVEVMASAITQPLEIALYDGAGERKAFVALARGEEVRLSGRASAGSQNRIRITRGAPHGEEARFRLRVRQVD